MKRSDMIKELEYLYRTIPDPASSWHIADMLLGRAERLGMQPPWYERNLTEAEAIERSEMSPDGLIYYKEDIIAGHTWEEEE